MSKIISETEFQRVFIKEYSQILVGSELLHSEFGLKSAMDILQGETSLIPSEDGEKISKGKNIGRIDLIFSYKRRVYACEIKCESFPKNNVWEALKILGYAKYYTFQTGNTRIKPAIIIPYDSIKLETQYITSALQITIFGLKYEKGVYKLFMFDRRPYWQQKSSHVM